MRSARGWLVSLGFLLVAVIVYLPILTTEYGFSDDYWALYTSLTKPAAHTSFLVGMGRPAAALLYALGFLFVRDVHSLVEFRTMGVAGAGLSATLLYLTARGCGYRRSLAILCSVGLLCLPSTLVAVSWAHLFQGTLALALWLGAGSLLLGEAGRHAAIPSRSKMVLAMVLLCLAVTLYQPGAMGFWLILVLGLLSPVGSTLAPLGWRSVLVRFLFVGGLACAAGLAVHRLGVAATGVAGPRAHLVSDYIGKANLLMMTAWPRIFDPWSRTPHDEMVFLFAPVLMFGVTFATRAPAWQPAARLGLVLLAFVLCYLPSIASAEDWFAFRTMLGLMPLLPIIVMATLEGLASRVKGRISWAFTGAAGAAALLAAAWSHTAARIYFSGPQGEELHRARAAVQQLPVAFPVAVVQAAPNDSLAPHIFFDELGYPSTAMAWGPVPLTELLYHEQHGEWLKEISRVGASQLGEIRKPAYLLDYHLMLRSPNQPCVRRLQ